MGRLMVMGSSVMPLAHSSQAQQTVMRMVPRMGLWWLVQWSVLLTAMMWPDRSSGMSRAHWTQGKPSGQLTLVAWLVLRSECLTLEMQLVCLKQVLPLAWMTPAIRRAPQSVCLMLVTLRARSMPGMQSVMLMPAMWMAPPMGCWMLAKRSARLTPVTQTELRLDCLMWEMR